jgi:hypothetical protein
MMFSAVRSWIEKRRALRRLWQVDAQSLIEQDEQSAYYTAQRLAARSRARGDRASFFHWSKVAAEVARLSPLTEMNYAVVETIVAQELRDEDSPGGTSRD